jgi:hypothetical protein
MSDDEISVGTQTLLSMFREPFKTQLKEMAENQQDKDKPKQPVILPPAQIPVPPLERKGSVILTD